MSQNSNSILVTVPVIQTADTKVIMIPDQNDSQLPTGVSVILQQLKERTASLSLALTASKENVRTPWP